jgi:hypothetical protein
MPANRLPAMTGRVCAFTQVVSVQIEQTTETVNALLAELNGEFFASMTAEPGTGSAASWPEEAEKLRNSLNVIAIDLQHLANAVVATRYRADALTRVLTTTEV